MTKYMIAIGRLRLFICGLAVLLPRHAHAEMAAVWQAGTAGVQQPTQDVKEDRDALDEPLTAAEQEFFLRVMCKPNDPSPLLPLFRRIQAGFSADDAASLAALIDFPITVAIDGRPVIVTAPAEFVANYGRIVDPEMKRVILEEREEDLFVNWRGFMLARGAIWSDGKRITQFKNTGMISGQAKGAATFLNPGGREVVHALHGDALRQGLGRLAGVLDFMAEADTNRADEVDYVWGDMCMYRFYLADLNNDGHDDYVVTETGTGSGGFGQIHGVWGMAGGKPVRLSFERIAARAFQPDDPEDFEWNHVQESLANPFIVRRGGTVYFGFDAGEYYVWRGESIQPADPLRP